MTPNRDRHLNDTQVLDAIIDNSDQDPFVVQHLAACTACRAEKTRLEEKLERLGRNTRRFSPAPTEPLALPDIEAVNHAGRFWSRHRILTAGLTACLILAVFYAAGVFNTGSRDTFSTASVEISGDDEIINQVCAFGENALPSWQRTISDESAEDQYDDFMKFIIPQVEADLSSLGGKGGWPC